MNISLKMCLLILSGFLASHAVTAQTTARPPTTRTPQISRDARFRSLDSTTPIRLHDYQGRVVVLTLWASWCIPCREALTGLGELQKEFAASGLQVIALSTEDPQKADVDVRRAAAGFPADYKVGWISGISADQLMGGKGLLPQIFVIRDGVILKTFLGWHSTKTAPLLRQTVETAVGIKSK